MNLVEAYAVTDATTAMIRQDWWPCKAGCNDCCQAWVLISETEGQAIRAALHQMNGKTIRNHARNTIKKARGFYGPLSIGELTKKMIGKNEKCPALVNGLCVLYESRPMACRLFGFSQMSEREVWGCDKVMNAVNDNGGAGCIDWVDWHKQFESALTGKYRPIVGWLAE